MVNAYMYQTAGTGGQPAAPGQVPPANTPSYNNYQPTPTQGYQVRNSSCVKLLNSTLLYVDNNIKNVLLSVECGLSSSEFAPHVPGCPH